MTEEHKDKFEWTIDEATFPKFKKAKIGEEFKSPEFEIGPKIKWNLLCYPNGKVELDSKNVQLYLSISSFPMKYKSITVFYQLRCAKTASNFSGIKSFKGVNEQVVWFRGVFTNEELINLTNIKTLTFECNINILQLDTTDNKTEFEYPLNIDFNEKSEFIMDWKISNELLNKFKTAKHGKFLSDNIIHSNMWSLQCAPNGYRNNDHGSVRLFMQLCALPPGIKSINLTRKLQCIEKDVERENTKDTPWGYIIDAKNDTEKKEIKMRQNSGWGRNALLKRDIDHLDEITFRVSIKVNGYCTNDGKKHEIIKKKVSGKKRKRDDKKKDKKKDKMDIDEESKEKDNNDKPPKKKRKTVKKKSDKEEISDEENKNNSDDDIVVDDIKTIEVDNKIKGGYEWMLSNDDLNKFKAAKFRKVFASNEFTVGELKWRIECYPSGHNKSDKDSESVGLFLTMMSKLSEDVGKMTVCWRLYNKPSGISYTGISEYSDTNNSFGICNNIFSKKVLNELKNTFDSKVIIGVQLVILNSINKKDLKAKIYKQIFPLKIRNGEDGISGESNENFGKRCSFEWKIDVEMMKKFKEAYFGKSFESSSFHGNMWNLRCIPNGEKKEDEGKVDLYLVLNAFPKGIGKMKVEFRLKCVESKTNSLLVHTFNVPKQAAGWNNVLNKTDIDGFESLTFKVFVEIKMFYDTKNKRIKTL